MTEKIILKILASTLFVIASAYVLLWQKREKEFAQNYGDHEFLYYFDDWILSSIECPKLAENFSKNVLKKMDTDLLLFIENTNKKFEDLAKKERRRVLTVKERDEYTASLLRVLRSEPDYTFVFSPETSASAKKQIIIKKCYQNGFFKKPQYISRDISPAIDGYCQNYVQFNFLDGKQAIYGRTKYTWSKLKAQYMLSLKNAGELNLFLSNIQVDLKRDQELKSVARKYVESLPAIEIKKGQIDSFIKNRYLIVKCGHVE